MRADYWIAIALLLTLPLAHANKVDPSLELIRDAWRNG